jgi:shikimate dehydrogenase
VSDLIYHPRETALLKGAKQQGAKVHEGLGMLVYQAAIAFEKWTGVPAPVSLMKQALANSLKDD